MRAAFQTPFADTRPQSWLRHVFGPTPSRGRASGNLRSDSRRLERDGRRDRACAAERLPPRGGHAEPPSFGLDRRTPHLESQLWRPASCSAADRRRGARASSRRCRSPRENDDDGARSRAAPSMTASLLSPARRRRDLGARRSRAGPGKFREVSRGPGAFSATPPGDPGNSRKSFRQESFGSTERRRSRTYRAVGYTTAPVLKPRKTGDLNGLPKPKDGAFASARASLRAGPATTQHPLPRTPGAGCPRTSRSRRPEPDLHLRADRDPFHVRAERLGEKRVTL
jgi:hypothetical protein